MLVPPRHSPEASPTTASQRAPTPYSVREFRSRVQDLEILAPASAAEVILHDYSAECGAAA